MLTALILGPEHQLLVAQAPGGELELPGRDCATLAALVERYARLGLALPSPIGVDPPRFAILLPQQPESAPEGHQWVALKDAPIRLKGQTYWELYTQLMLGGYEPPSRGLDVFQFGNEPYMAARLAHLVIKGKKRATTGNLTAMKKLGLAIPTAGLVSIVTDGFGIPLCCIRTERIDIKRFRDVPEAVARGEGEGDLSLASWREGHWKYFTREAAELGLSFDEDTEVFNEWFRVLHVFGSELSTG